MSHVQERDDDVNDGFFDVMIRRRRTKKSDTRGIFDDEHDETNGQKGN